MDRVFPENMNPVNVNDTRQSLETIESYVRYMRERLEYSFTVLTKLNSGTSLADLSSRMSTLETRIGSLTSTVNALGERVSDLENALGDIETLLSQI